MGTAAKRAGDRKFFLDVLRVAATVAVVLMHTISGVLNGNYDFTGYERRVKAFQALVDATSWSVPVFLMISGYLFLNPEKKITWKDALLKYCRRIFLAIWLFGLPFSFLEIFGYVRHFEGWMVGHVFVSVATGQTWAHMWYLYLILILYAATPLIKWILEKVPGIVIYFIMSLLALGVGVVPYVMVLCGASRVFVLPSWGIYLFYYLCGYVFVTRKREAGKAEGPICLGLFFLVLALEMGSRFVEGYAVNMAYGYPPTILAALLLFNAAWAMEQRGIRPLPRVITWLSPLCFGIYLIHPVFLNLFYKFLHLSIMNFRFYAGVPLFFGIAFAGSIIGTLIMRLIPPLRKYVL